MRALPHVRRSAASGEGVIWDASGAGAWVPGAVVVPVTGAADGGGAADAAWFTGVGEGPAVFGDVADGVIGGVEVADVVGAGFVECGAAGVAGDDVAVEGRQGAPGR